MWPIKPKQRPSLQNVVYMDANDNESVTRTNIRDNFWKAVRWTTPHVFETLQDTVYEPFYKAVHASERLGHPTVPMGRLLGIRHHIKYVKTHPPPTNGRGIPCPPYFDVKTSEALLEALEDWGSKYNLKQEWALALALETMHLWAEFPRALELMAPANSPDDLRTYSGTSWTFKRGFGPIVLETFEHTHYSPWMPSRDYLEICLEAYAETLPERGREFRIKRMGRVIEKKIRKDIASWEQQGLKARHKPTKSHIHARWTVLALIEKMNARAISDSTAKHEYDKNSKIVETAPVGERAVQKGIKTYCWLLGIETPLRRGNPKLKRK